jgi:dTMP kinase
MSKFITLEGTEFSGKSTQSKMLHKYFVNSGVKAISTREPGGTSFGEVLRELFIKSENLASETELMLNMAARSEHINKVIIPAMNVGINVICDRFIDSTCVYQGIVGNLGIEKVLDFHSKLFNNILPDITFFLDIPPEIALERKFTRKEEANRFDDQNLEYHNAIYKGFKAMAKANPDRIISIDATLSIQEIHNNIVGVYEHKIYC